MADTSPAEDVQALRAAIIGVLHTAPFDDMEWPEIEAAMFLVHNDVRVVFANYGGFDLAPPPGEPPVAYGTP